MKCYFYQAIVLLSLITILVILWLAQRISNTKVPINEDVSNKRDALPSRFNKSRKENLGGCITPEICHKMKRPIIINAAKGILFCPIPKVASTSIKLALVRESKNIIGGYKVHNSSEMKRAGFVNIHKFHGEQLMVHMHKLKKLIVVRHPLERLLSAYLDKFKLKNKWTKYFQLKYGTRIISKYRSVNKVFGDQDITFREFVEFVTDETSSCENRMDPHWAPYWILCRVCRIKYDFVVKMDNLTKGLNEFWLRVFRKPMNKTIWSWEHRGLHDTKGLMESYFSTLPGRLMGKLYDLFRLDFDLFGFERDYKQSYI